MKIAPVFFGDRLILQVVVLVDATNFWSYEDLKIIMCVFMYVRKYVWMCVCVCAYICVCVFMYTCQRRLNKPQMNKSYTHTHTNS
jgi:ascorbate-specific PTS system EIIC-type component UlaA